MIIFLSLCIFAVVCILLFFAYVVKTAPEFDTKKLVRSESTLVYDSKNELITESIADKIISAGIKEVEIRTERLSFWPWCRRQGAGNTGISQKK